MTPPRNTGAALKGGLANLRPKIPRVNRKSLHGYGNTRSNHAAKQNSPPLPPQFLLIRAVATPTFHSSRRRKGPVLTVSFDTISVMPMPTYRSNHPEPQGSINETSPPCRLSMLRAENGTRTQPCLALYHTVVGRCMKFGFIFFSRAPQLWNHGLVRLFYAYLVVFQASASKMLVRLRERTDGDIELLA